MEWSTWKLVYVLYFFVPAIKTDKKEKMYEKDI